MPNPSARDFLTILWAYGLKGPFLMYVRREEAATIVENAKEGATKLSKGIRLKRDAVIDFFSHSRLFFDP